MDSREGYLWLSLKSIPESDIGLNDTDEVAWGFVDSDEGTVVNLTQSQESQDSDNLGVQLVDTPDSHHEGDSWSAGYINLSWEFCGSSCVNLSQVVLGILGIILLCSFQDFWSLGFVSCASLLSLFFPSGVELRISFLFLFETFWFRWHFLLSRHCLAMNFFVIY